MKKKIIIICAIVLAVSCLSAIIVMASCKGFGKKPDVDDNPVVTPIEPPSSYPTFEGSGNYIVNNGKSDYVVVIPENSTEKERLASSELVGIINESTGIKLKVITDKNLDYNNNSKYISIGKTNLIDRAGVTIAEDAKGINAFQISNKDKSLFLIGGKEYGVIYSVYEFLRDVVNFETYYSDCYTLDTSVIDIELKKYNDYVCKPDILRTMGTAGFMAVNKTIAMRMRSPYKYVDIYATDNEIPFAHSSLKYLPTAKYSVEHPAWFSDDRTQLCYTAHGDADEYQKMLEAFTDRLKELIKTTKDKGKDAHEYDLSNMDVSTSCGCTACREANEKYNAISGAYVIFANKASEIIVDWMKNDEVGKRYYDEDFRIKIMAYQMFENAPVVYNEEDDSYRPASEEVVLAKNVVVMVAPIATNFVQSIHTDKNSVNYKTIQSWKAISPENNMDFWLYCTNFRYYMLPYDSFNYMVEYREVLRDANALSFNDQTQNGNYSGMSGWHILKAYLSSKLSYNVNLDMNELTDNFFNAYFDVAADDMKEFYYGWRRFSLYQQNVLEAYNTSRSIYFEALNKKYWPKSILDDWYELANRAMDKIAIYKDTDSEKYNSLYRHISCERASIEYLYLSLYSSELGNKREQIKDNFIEAVTINNINCPNEGGQMSSFINSL